MLKKRFRGLTAVGAVMLGLMVLLYAGPQAAGRQSFIYVAAPADFIATTDGTISPYVLVIDATTLREVTRIPLPSTGQLKGERYGMAIAPDGRYLYVLHSDGLSEIDLRTHTVTQTIETGGVLGRGHLTIRNDGRQAFASGTFYGSTRLFALPIGGAAPVNLGDDFYDLGPDIVASPVAPRVYLTAGPSGTRSQGLQEYDATTGQRIATIAGAVSTPLAISPNGSTLYVSQLASPGVVILDTATRQQLGTFDDVNAARVFAGLAGRFLYTLNQGSVRVFDALERTRSAVMEIGLAKPGVNVVASEDESTIFIAAAVGTVTSADNFQTTTRYANSVLALDRVSGRQLAELVLPDSIRITSGTSHLNLSKSDGVTPMAVTLPGTPRCSYRVSTTTSTWSTAGGSGSVTLTTPCGWVASSDASWIHLQQTSGASGGTITFTVDPATTGAGRNGTLTIAGQLVSVSQAGYAQNPPYGVFDTPVDGSLLTGSVALTGWALDDVGVTGVQLWRDPHPSDPAAAIFAGPGPQAGKIFIGNGTFIDGARPDVAAAFPNAPQKTRSGWGYLMLTRGLVWDGRGPFRLYAYATDVEGNVAAIGSKLVSVDNTTATRPFGAMDTPPQGGTISGFYAVTGWVLTPNSGATIRASGVRVAIDGAFLPDVPSMSSRGDITAAFPDFDTSQAGRGIILDTTKYADGLHTIGFLVTDSLGMSDGVGGRFFTIDNSSSGASDLWARLNARAASRTSVRTSR